MSLLRKNIYELVCKNAESGKEAWVMLQEYIAEMVYTKVENTPYEEQYYDIADNVFFDSEKIKARSIKEVDTKVNALIENELNKIKVISN